MSQLTDNLNQIVSIKSDIKDAIEAKGVSMSGVSFGSYADKIGEIQTGGQFVTETLNVSVNNTYYPGQGVDGFSQVVVNVPQSVAGYTEKDVTEGIQVVNLSNSASYVRSYAFYKDSNLRTVNLPNCISVYESAFNGCTNLETINIESCLNFQMYAFTECSKLQSINLPNYSDVGAQKAFQNCFSLSTVYIPLLKGTQNYMFRECRALLSVDFPKCGYVGSSTFFYCSSLSYVNLPLCSIINQGAFTNCPLSAIYIGKDLSIVTDLKNVNAFTGTPIASGTGSIYVPTSLVDAYKSAKNWSAFSSQIFSIQE